MALSFESRPTMGVISEVEELGSTSWIGFGMKDCAAARKVDFLTMSNEEVKVANKSASFLKDSDTSPFSIGCEYGFDVWTRRTI